jgi:hypothetical protein
LDVEPVSVFRSAILPSRAFLIAFSIALYVLLDVGLAIVAARLSLVPNEHAFRKRSEVYHHDLVANVAGLAEWGSSTYSVYTNSLGFKDREVREVPLRSDRHRVLLIGDSFTEGLGYAYEETFAGLIDASLAARGVETLNAAVTSYSPLIYYRKTKYLIEDVKLDFDEVVVFLDISDIEDEAKYYRLSPEGVVFVPDGAEKEPPDFAARTRDVARRYSLLGRAVVALLRRFGTGPASSARGDDGGWPDAWREVLAFPRGNWTHDPEQYEAYGRRGLVRAQRSLDRLHELLRTHGKALTLVVYPWPNQIYVRDRSSLHVRTFSDWARTHGVRFIDLFPVFMDHEPPEKTIPHYYIPGDCHFNREGHALVAAAFLRAFRTIEP